MLSWINYNTVKKWFKKNSTTVESHFDVLQNTALDTAAELSTQLNPL